MSTVVVRKYLPLITYLSTYYVLGTVEYLIIGSTSSHHSDDVYSLWYPLTSAAW